MDRIEAAISRYRMSDGVSELVRSTKLLLISGVVGGGKNTVINELFDEAKYHMIVSHTTRAPRVNHGLLEEDGVDSRRRLSQHWVLPASTIPLPPANCSTGPGDDRGDRS